MAGGRDGAAEAAELRAAGIDGPLLVLGALSPRSSTWRSRRDADVVAWREAFVARWRRRGRPRGVHVKLDTGMGRLGTRDPEATRVAARRRRARPRAGGRDDPLRDRRRGPRRLLARAARALHRRGRAAARAPPPAPRARRQQRRRAARARRRTSTSCAAASRSTAWTRSTRTRPSTASSRRWSCAPTSPRSSRARRGERRLRPPLRGRARHLAGTLPIGYGDGLRRGLTNNADVLVGGRRAAGRHGLDGQHHRRPRPTAAAAAATRRC